MAFTKEIDVSFDNWLGGELIQRIDDALEKAIKNCLDPNYDSSPRKIKFTVKLKVNERRDEVVPEFNLAIERGKLRFMGPAMTIGVDSQGRGVAREMVDRQQTLFNQGVIPMVRGGDDA